MSRESKIRLYSEDSVQIQEASKYPRGCFGLVFRYSNGDEPEILLVKRKDFDIWNLPGGGAEGEEEVFAAVVRETLEETGLIVEPVYTDSFTIDPPRNTQNPIGAENRWDAFLGIVCRIEGGELRLTNESTAIRWFPVYRLPRDTYTRHALLIQSFVKDERNTQILQDITKEHSFMPTDIFED